MNELPPWVADQILVAVRLNTGFCSKNQDKIGFPFPSASYI